MKLPVLKVFPSSPLLRIGVCHQIVPLMGRFLNGQEWSNFDFADIQIVENPLNADVIVLSQFINEFLESDQFKLADDFILNALKHSKPVWVFSHGDQDFALPWKNVYHLRNSVYGNAGSRDIPMPYFNQDPIISNALQYYPLHFSKAPSIGFCGQSNISLSQIMKLIAYRLFQVLKQQFTGQDKLKRFDFFISPYERARVLKVFKQMEGIESDFIERDRYRAGIAGSFKVKNAHPTTKEYFDNIQRNQYTICIRGGGNFSLRFFHVMSLGRIPLFINCNSSFPLENLLKRQKLVPVFNLGEEHLWEQQLIEFHNHWRENFGGLQSALREFWLTHYQVDNFFHHVYLEQIKNETASLH